MPHQKIKKIKDIDGSDLFLFWDSAGYWVDEHGTKYPDFFDEGYPGLDPFTTGPWDPFWKDEAKDHDEAFAAKKTGYEGNTNVDVALKFSKGVAVKMAKGAYAVVLGVPYILVGGLLGMIRWASIGRKDGD